MSPQPTLLTEAPLARGALERLLLVLLLVLLVERLLLVPSGGGFVVVRHAPVLEQVAPPDEALLASPCLASEDSFGWQFRCQRRPGTGLPVGLQAASGRQGLAARRALHQRR